MIEFANILREAGLTVSEYPGWRQRGHVGTFAPFGGVWHHTGGRKDLEIVAKVGRPDLAAPLANLFLDTEGVWHVVAAGVAWHAGAGHAAVLTSVGHDVAPTGFAADLGLADDYGSGNHYLVGVEVENLGTAADPYPAVQVEALVKGSAALCKALHWTANRWIHHREWTARKVDMSLADKLDLRALVAAELGSPAASGPTGVTKESDVQKILVIDAPGRPKAVLSLGGPHVFRPLGPAEWQALWRSVARGTDENGKATGETGWRDPDVQIVIETRPQAEYDAATGFQP